MPVEQFANNALTVLTQALSATATSMNVQSATRFPQQPQYRVVVDDEIILVTGGCGTTTWEVQRGQEDTVAASHAAGATVAHVLTVAGLRAISGGITIEEMDGSPSVQSITKLKVPNGTLTDNGDGSVRLFGNVATVWLPDAPPASPSAYDDEFDDAALDSKWTFWNPRNNSNNSATEDEAGLLLTLAYPVTIATIGVHQPAPTGDFAFGACLGVHALYQTYVEYGIMLGEDLAANPLTSDTLMWGIEVRGSDSGLIVQRLNQHDSWNSNPFTRYVSVLSPTIYPRIRRIGSTLYFDISLDGRGYLQAYSMAQPFTVRQIGIILDKHSTADANDRLYVRAYWFRATTDTSRLAPLGGRRVRVLPI